MNRKVIYTVLLGDKDNLKPILPPSGFDCFAIVTENVAPAEGWKLLKVESTNHRYDSRRYKTLSRQYFADYDLSIYCDASYVPRGNLNEFVAGKEEGVWLQPHPQRKCAYREAQVVLDKGIDDFTKVTEQVAKYREAGYPDNNGLWRGGLIIRNKGCEEFEKEWWKEIENGSWRDQISLPYALHRTGVVPSKISPEEVFNFFQPTLHKPHTISSHIAKCEIEDIYKVDRNDWVQLGEFEQDVSELIREYPLVHLICSDTGYLFPRWLHDYLFDIDNLDKHVLAFGGKLVYMR